MIIQGKIKFVHPNGFGFATTDVGDVFFHLSKFRRPRMEYSRGLGQPTVAFAEETIKPASTMVGHTISLDIVDGEKGLSAKLWWYTDDLEFADAERAAMPFYRLVSRRIVVSQPFAVPEERTWKSRHFIVEDVNFEGYLPDCDRFLRPFSAQVQIEQQVGDKWKPVECPLGRFHGGHLFDRPLSWSEVV